MQVAVIGAGIVGITTAWYLHAKGISVTLIDPSDAGTGASEANGGQLSYDFVSPLAEPQVLKKIPGWLLDTNSPLKFRPSFDPDQCLWIIKFLAACTKRQSAQTTVALLQLAARSRELAVELFATEKINADYAVPGKLVIHRSAATLAAAESQRKFQESLGSTQSLKNANACLEIEPALAASRRDIAGGIWTPTEGVVDTQKLCKELLAKLALSPRMRIERSAVADFRMDNGSIIAAITDSGEVVADAFVLAAGIASVKLGKKLGVRLPIQALKGYSITVDVSEPKFAPVVSITDVDKKIVFARLGNRLRVAGMAELVGNNTEIEAKRITQLKTATQHVFGPCGDFTVAVEWAGLRPATPTGMPLLGTTSIDNLFLNVGHGALGLTLSFSCAEYVAKLVIERASRTSKQVPSTFTGTICSKI